MTKRRNCKIAAAILRLRCFSLNFYSNRDSKLLENTSGNGEGAEEVLMVKNRSQQGSNGRKEGKIEIGECNGSDAQHYCFAVRVIVLNKKHLSFFFNV